MQRSLIALIATATCALLSAPPASGKGDVHARLENALPRAAPPGTAIGISWTLSYEEGSERRPFDAGGLFVLLLSASGGKSTKAQGKGRSGRYRARAIVPEGGIGGVRFGLEGTRYMGVRPGRGKGEDADIHFPLDNDPFAARVSEPARARTPADTAGASSSAPTWLVVIGAIGVLAAALATARANAARRARRT